MRVLHINVNYLTTPLHQIMIEHLSELDVNNVVFAPVYDEENKRIDPNSNVVISRCFRKWDRVFYFLKQRKIQKALIKSLDVSKYKLVHAYTLFSDGNTAMKISQKYGIPYIITVRGTDLNDFFHLKPYLIPYGFKIMENASKIIFLSKAYQDIMFRKYIPERKQRELIKKSVILPNGIDDFWIKNLYYGRNYTEIQKRLERKEIKIICVANILKDKNIPFLQKVLEKAREEGWKIQLHLIGKAIDRKELNRIEKDKFTIYHGSKNKEELIQHYRDNDIFILVSHTESFGLVYAEAMSQGLPVIYTAGEGFDQQFEDGYVGFPASDRNAYDLLDKIFRVISDYKRISENCLKSVMKFEWNRIVKSYKGIYECIINDNGVE